MKPWTFLALSLCILVGCTDNPLDSEGPWTESGPVERASDTKLRHPQLVDLSAGSVAGKGSGEEATHVFIGLREYESDGVTRRVLDMYGVTRRILEQYGVTRRVLEQYGVTRRVLEQYGVASGTLDAFTTVLRQLEPLGISREDAEAVDYDITLAFFNDHGLSDQELADHGIDHTVLSEFGITRRILHEYGISIQAYLDAVDAWERTIRLKARIDSARPGLFVSLGGLPLTDFVEEAATDDDIDIIEIDVEVDMEPVGTLTEAHGGSELLPWGIAEIGGGQSDAGDTHVFLVDSGVELADLNIVERSDFSDVYKDRGQTNWDDQGAIERTLYGLTSLLGNLLGFNSPGYGSDQLSEAGDVTGHGTHLAGIIGALANGKLVVGGSPGAKIHSLRVMTERGQSDIATVVSALDYIASVRMQHPDWKMVVNMSLGMYLGSTSYNVLDEAVKRLTQMGIIVVVSAGNSGADASLYSPAHVAEAITVGAYNKARAFSSFSNWGPVVDVLAPGEFIASLSWESKDAERNVALIESGTSQAAAHVTGLVAHYLNAHPLARPDDVRNALVRGSVPGISGVPSGTVARSVYLDTSSRSSVLGGARTLLGGLLGGRSRR